jgi:DNA-binding transcriptional ArsR family regulator
MGTADERRLSETLEVLSDPYRRRALRYLSDRTDPVSLAELADGVAESTAETSGRTVETVKLALHHVHLPKLAQAGLVEYSPNHGNVSLAATGRLERLLRLASQTGASDSRSDGR